MVNGTFGKLAMVVKEKDDGIINFSGGFESIKEGAEGVIKPKEVGGIIVNRKAGGTKAFRNSFTVRLNCGRFVEVTYRSQAGIGFPGALCLSGAVRDCSGEVKEKGVGMRLFKKAHTSVGDPVHVLNSDFM